MRYIRPAIAGGSPSLKILVRQLNGLGNQLFRYAAAVHVAERFGAGVENIVQFDRDPARHEVGRSFLLDRFAIASPCRPASAFDRFVQSEKPLFKPVAGMLRQAGGMVLFEEPEHHHVTPVPEALGQARLVYMHGFWQVAHYAEASAARLRRELRFATPPTGQNATVLSHIRSDAQAVSVHVRRTDYVALDLPQKPVADSYYQRAIAEIERRVPSPSFYVFGDDMAYARQLFGHDGRFRFVDHNGSDTAHEDLRLMAACHHHIIANSTFSWWGAWLGDNPQKTVIAPRRWWGVSDAHFPDIYPRGWTVIGD